MSVLAILQLVVQLVPVAKSLIATISALRGQTQTPAIVDAIASLAPIAANLVATIEKIRTQTEADHAAVWAPIRDDWKSAAAQWAALQGK